MLFLDFCFFPGSVNVIHLATVKKVGLLLWFILSIGVFLLFQQSFFFWIGCIFFLSSTLIQVFFFPQDNQSSQDSKASRSGPSEGLTVSSSSGSTEAAVRSPKLEEPAEVQKEAPSSTSPIDLSTKKSSEPESSPAAAASGPVKASQGTHAWFISDHVQDALFVQSLSNQ